MTGQPGAPLNQFGRCLGLLNGALGVQINSFLFEENDAVVVYCEVMIGLVFEYLYHAAGTWVYKDAVISGLRYNIILDRFLTGDERG